VIVTRIVSTTILLSSLLLFSCQTAKSTLTEPWNTKKIDKYNLTKTTLNEVDDGLIADIQEDYKNNPNTLSYDELKLFSVYLDRSRKRRVLIFDIMYVHDIQVVYEVDDKGRILNKYLFSAWN